LVVGVGTWLWWGLVVWAHCWVLRERAVVVWSLVDGAGLRHTGCHLIPGLPLCGLEGMGGGVWWRVGLVAVCCL